MTYMVELRYIGGNLADLTRDMRKWLDRERIEAEVFHHSLCPPGLAFRVGFGSQENATAFAQTFGGWVECADPQGIVVRWTTPPAPPGRAPPRSRS